MIWLFLPNFKGATIIYDKIIIKFFNKYRAQIDELEHNIGNRAGEYMGRVQENVKDANNVMNFRNEITGNTNSNMKM